MSDAILAVQQKGRNGEFRTIEDDDVLLAGGKLPKFDILTTPAASATTGTLASLSGNSATNEFTISAQPDVPRNIAIAFAASWDGGDVVLTGTNQFDEEVTETIVAVADSTVVGNVAFKTLTSAVKTAVGADAAAATGGRGSKLGLSAVPFTAQGVLFVTGVAEAATFNRQYATVLAGTNVPNGTRTYMALYNQ